MTVELNRIRWRCRRGLLELDIVLARFIEQHYVLLTPSEKVDFDDLLAFSDNELWDLISRPNAVATSQNERLISLLREC